MPTIKVPEYEKQVNIPTPNLPNVDVRSNIPQAAFGGEVIQAYTNLGQSVVGIGELTQKKIKEKKFDAIKVMREIRDKISLEIMNMTFEEERAYLDKLIAARHIQTK